MLDPPCLFCFLHLSFGLFGLCRFSFDSSFHFIVHFVFAALHLIYGMYSAGRHCICSQGKLFSTAGTFRELLGS